MTQTLHICKYTSTASNKQQSMQRKLKHLSQENTSFILQSPTLIKTSAVLQKSK